ncbi:hypothetical protein FB45DRAFT_1064928 [Roridomyces roridus]|uniref:Uncharacterized protein n=1 Tax=Roridomyces roridus TaxID=1738132 RepID=A0AAD7FBI9_9AGAR|nr:hypothetical protein FB45DRAFT_1064928 [Roridomyces roridus]
MTTGTAVDILILGAGWTSTFLIPLCVQNNLTCAATTRSGSGSTIQFSFDPTSDDPEPYKGLPDAKTVLVSFPIVGSGASERLVTLYRGTRHGEGQEAGFIQLGTTSIWDKAPETLASLGLGGTFYDRHSPFTLTGRSNAEAELLTLSRTTVLNLAGLWGGQRVVKNWLGRVAPTKEALKAKGSIHLIHGLDLARAILAVHSAFDKAAGQRWLLTDGRVYDWWDLASAWGDEDGPARWVRELMQEEEVRVLPRNTELLGRVLDSREFWSTFGLSPLKARLETELTRSEGEVLKGS